MTEAIVPPITVADPAEAARQWFILLGRYCAAVDYDANEAIFADDVVSFGTRATVVAGLGPLRSSNGKASGGTSGASPWTSGSFTVAAARRPRLGHGAVVVDRVSRGR
ncbi:MAG: hypothetical protein R3E68_20950 [Burkholderiaceae bacterium]